MASSIGQSLCLWDWLVTYLAVSAVKQASGLVHWPEVFAPPVSLPFSHLLSLNPLKTSPLLRLILVSGYIDAQLPKICPHLRSPFVSFSLYSSPAFVSSAISIVWLVQSKAFVLAPLNRFHQSLLLFPSFPKQPSGRFPRCPC
jgi:hypothetical protein